MEKYIRAISYVVGKDYTEQEFNAYIQGVRDCAIFDDDISNDEYQEIIDRTRKATDDWYAIHMDSTEAESVESEGEGTEEAEPAQEPEIVESEQEKVFEFTTWQYGEEWKEAEQKAITAAKNHNGEKFTVAIGEWGSRTFLVLADSKEEAKALAIEYYNATSANALGDNKIKVRNVTNCKKYN